MKTTILAKLRSWEFILFVLVIVMLLVAASVVPGFTRPFSVSTGLATFAPRP